MDFSEKIRAWWSDFQPRQAGHRSSVRFDDSGIEQMGSPSPTQLLEWQQITDVYAYKKDCFSMDQIRILLGDEAQRKWIEVTEHDEGYKELIAELPHRLPGCLSEGEWWRNVAMPPFETQWTRLYHRQ